MESFFCFKTMMNKKSIVKDHKVMASNVSLADLTDSIKTILEKQNRDMIKIKVIPCMYICSSLGESLQCSEFIIIKL